MRTMDIGLAEVDASAVEVVQGVGATVLTSVVELFGPLEGRLPAAVQARARGLARQVEFGPLAPLRNRVPLPEALFLVAASSSVFTEGLDLVDAHAEVVVEQIEGDFPGNVPEVYRPWLRNPRAAMGEYLAALQAYHDVVVRDLYPQLAGLLAREADIYRRVIDAEGIRFLSRLHPKVKRHGEGLRYVEPYRSGQLSVKPRVVVFMPMVCAPQTVATNIYGDFAPDTVGFAFASPNLAVTGSGSPDIGHGDPLATLLGTTRARLVRELLFASTTLDLASRLGLSPSTVSHHLQVLTGSDTVTSYRAGPFVFYRLTDRGHALLRAYGDPP